MGAKKLIILAMTLFFISLFIPGAMYAEVIVFKSGKTIEGKITKRTDKYITVDVYGVESPYYLDDIEDIKSAPVNKEDDISLSPLISKKAEEEGKKTEPDIIQEHIDRASLLIFEGKLSEALIEFNKAIKINPDDVRIYLKRGLCYIRYFKELDLSISDFSRAIKIDPNQKEAYGLRARAYYANKEYDKSWQDVHRAEALGYKFSGKYKFIENLSKDSGRNK